MAPNRRNFSPPGQLPSALSGAIPISTDRYKPTPPPEVPFTPTEGWVVLHILKPSDVTKAGLIIPEGSNPETAISLITAIGPNVKRTKVGNQVICKAATPNNNAELILLFDKKFVMMPEDAILGILTDSYRVAIPEAEAPVNPKEPA